MKIRIHDTDFEGHPLDCSGDYFTGETALDIVEAMGMNPYQSHLTPHGLMYETLEIIGQKNFQLPEDPGKAAIAFLQRLTALGYAKFELDDGEFLTQHGIATSPVNNEKDMQNKP